MWDSRLTPILDLNSGVVITIYNLCGVGAKGVAAAAAIAYYGCAHAEDSFPMEIESPPASVPKKQNERAS